MPEGPAIGRVEAKRRALTTPSTAPASKTRWCDGKIWIAEPRRSFRENMRTRANRFCSSIHRPHCSGESGHEVVHAGGAFVLHELCTQTATCGTTNDGVNDPVTTAWGQSQGRTAGSFTPSLVQ